MGENESRSELDELQILELEKALELARAHPNGDTDEDTAGQDKVVTEDVERGSKQSNAANLFRLLERLHQVDSPLAGVSGTDEARHPRADLPGPDSDAESAQQLGPYDIVRKLGEGGYGIVFLAIDRRMDRPVALKIPRPQVMADDATRKRFLREAKAAGSLNHAHIVPVFEVIQSGSLCYIASAYYEGQTLSRWVKEAENPIPPQVACDWMISLADAVQHAHSRGVIHRDLKPDNILVEIDTRVAGDTSPSNLPSAPMLHITDFGLARVQNDHSVMTQSGDLIGTPSFMAPEQTDASADSSKHLVDIYGLGAILYFVLCQNPPITGNTIVETIANVREQPPVPPTKMRPELPRDLEAICLKCLEKQPRHRYQTATELQSDLLRFQSGLPVRARRPSATDRAIMWCRRRPAVTALAVLLLFVLAAGSIVLGFLLARSNSLKQLSDSNANKAASAATLAMTERNRAREALQAMTSSVASNWLGSQKELTAQQRSFLDTTVGFYREFSKGSTENPEDQFWVAQAEHRLARLLTPLGQIEPALNSYDRAISLLQDLPAAWKPATVSLELATTLHHKETVLMFQGKAAEALPIAEQAANISRELVAVDPTNTAAKLLLAEVTRNLGTRYQSMRRLDDALAIKTESVQILEQLLSDNPDDFKIKKALGLSYMNLGTLMNRMRQPEESRVWLDRSLKVRKELVESDPESEAFQFDLSFVLGNLAVAAYVVNDYDEAATFSVQATDINRRLVEQFPSSEIYRRHLIHSLINMAGIFNKRREFEESERVLVEANSMAQRSIRDFPGIPIYRLLLVQGQTNLGSALAEQGQPQESMRLFDQSIEQLRKMIDESVETDRAVGSLINSLKKRSPLLSDAGRHDEAIADWDEVIRLVRPEEVNSMRLFRANALCKSGDADRALAEVERVLVKTIESQKSQTAHEEFFNAARVYALVSTQIDDENISRKHAIRAIDLLRNAIDAGLRETDRIRSDPQLESLHGYEEFQELVQ